MTVKFGLKPAEVRSQLEGLGEKIVDLRSKERTDEVRAELRDAIGEVSELDCLLRIAQRAAEAEAEAADAAGPRGGTRQAGEPDYRSAGEQFTESDEYRNWGGNGTVEVRTLLTSAGGIPSFKAAATNGIGLLRPLGVPQFMPNSRIRQRLFLRDVLSNITTGLASVPYIKELNAMAAVNAANGAQMVAEGGQKPELNLEFTADDAPIRKIAAWIPATYEILSDAPTLRGYIDERLSYALAIAEERALLSGNGTAPNIRGLLASSPQTQAFVTDPFITLGLAMSKLEVVDGEPSFIAMHPSDYWAAQTTRFANHFEGSQGVSSNPAPFGSPPSEIWGVPVIRTVGVTVGSALVGCRTGAVVLDRERPIVRVGDQHLDYFTTNRVAILTEERIGLAVHRPDWFVQTALTVVV